MPVSWILSQGTFQGDIPQSLLELPDFRRATRNQMMAYLAIQECLKTVPESLLRNKERVGFVLGTSHGELDSTVSFLSELGVTGTARPFYFQSSLHHSILGFLTKTFGFTGPSLTVCNSYRSGEDAIRAAELLLQSVVDVVLVVGVDALVPKIAGPLLSMYPEGTKLSEGAGALLFAKDLANAGSTQVLARFKEQVFLSEYSGEAAPFGYDSSAVEILARNIASTKQIVIEKPGKTFSKLVWE